MKACIPVKRNRCLLSSTNLTPDSSFDSLTPHESPSVTKSTIVTNKHRPSVRRLKETGAVSKLLKRLGPGPPEEDSE